MINIAICDDEAILVDIFARRIADILQAKDIKNSIFKYVNGIDLLKDIKNGIRINVLFLDISMPNIDGFKLAEEINKLFLDIKIIFLTSHSDKIAEGYKYKAFRFLIKDGKDEFLEEALFSSIKEIRNKEIPIEFKIKDEYGEKKYLMINKSEIIYLEHNARTLEMHTTKGLYTIATGTLNEIYNILGALEFTLVHRSYIINFKHIKYFTDYRICMSNNVFIQIGTKKNQVEKVKKLYFEYLENKGD